MFRVPVAVSLIVLCLLSIFGCSSQNTTSGCNCPTAGDAKLFVLQNNLLVKITKVDFTPPGPIMTSVEGVDQNGLAKIIWLQGSKKDSISTAGSAYFKEGVSKEMIISHMTALDAQHIESTYLLPFFGNKKTTGWWFLVKRDQKDVRLYYDFKSGQLLQSSE